MCLTAIYYSEVPIPSSTLNQKSTFAATTALEKKNRFSAAKNIIFPDYNNAKAD